MKNYLSKFVFLFVVVFAFVSCNKDQEPEQPSTANAAVSTTKGNTAPIVGSINTTKSTKNVFGDVLSLTTSASDKDGNVLMGQ